MQSADALKSSQGRGVSRRVERQSDFNGERAGTRYRVISLYIISRRHNKQHGLSTDVSFARKLEPPFLDIRDDTANING